ncbi:hypothetical protein SEA_IDYN_4 [Gordonia phage IDyn]|uniref:Uncharacterized protein n=1 Tax=Gordonia phage IDyn TaxID=2510506 RepID=A0A411CU38_9CAUD|nr:hypothetical protein KNU47_gp04 [Gordonia phage IDyn]QAY17352.1 hypothetical protein SEA_IDYN_4 [Gordonia phage IDyn]
MAHDAPFPGPTIVTIKCAAAAPVIQGPSGCPKIGICIEPGENRRKKVQSEMQRMFPDWMAIPTPDEALYSSQTLPMLDWICPKHAEEYRETDALRLASGAVLSRVLDPDKSIQVPDGVYTTGRVLRLKRGDDVLTIRKSEDPSVRRVTQKLTELTAEASKLLDMIDGDDASDRQEFPDGSDGSVESRRTDDLEDLEDRFNERIDSVARSVATAFARIDSAQSDIDETMEALREVSRGLNERIDNQNTVMKSLMSENSSTAELAAALAEEHKVTRQTIKAMQDGDDWVPPTDLIPPTPQRMTAAENEIHRLKETVLGDEDSSVESRLGTLEDMIQGIESRLKRAEANITDLADTWNASLPKSTSNPRTDLTGPPNTSTRAEMVNDRVEISMTAKKFALALRGTVASIMAGGEPSRVTERDVWDTFFERLRKYS